MDFIIDKHKLLPQKRNYFIDDTENAIIAYNISKDSHERSLLYENHIHWPFYKLTENIIHTFKFYHTDGVDNLEDLQHEIMIFLLKKIHLFNPKRGTKAYSYFGTIVKRWLITYNQKNYKNKLENISIDSLNDNPDLDITDTSFISSNQMSAEMSIIMDRDEGDDDNYMIDNEFSNRGYKYEDKLSVFMDLYIEYCTYNVYNIFPKGQDAQIADAILELFRKRDAIDIFNKKALYIYIREQIDVKTPKITKIAKVLYNIYKEKYLYYLDHGAFLS